MLDLDWPEATFVDEQVYAAARALHDEAHADDRTVFRHCVRQTCRDLLYAFEAHECLGWTKAEE